MKSINRIRGLFGVSLRQLSNDKTRTGFAIIGIAFAVLSVTLLYGVGTGVVETGETLLDDSDRDLWVTGGPISIQPGTVGTFQNTVIDAHAITNEIQSHEEVRQASPIAFQTVYISRDGEEFESLMGSGVRNGEGFLEFEDGGGFTNGTAGDTHRAGGSYDGPMTHEAIVDPAIAEKYNLTVNDTLHVGGAISGARRNEFTIVGISSTFRNFVGSQTVMIRLSELQTLTGTAYDDRVSFITIELEDDADVSAVKTDLENSYPEYTIRTNREQLEATIERQTVIIATGLSLVGLAVLSGMLLSANLFLSLIYQQREHLAVFNAIGGSQLSAIVIVLVQSVIIAVLGSLLGLALSPVLATGLESVAASVTGFEGLVRIPQEGYLAGLGVASIFGLIGAIGGALRLVRQNPTAILY